MRRLIGAVAGGVAAAVLVGCAQEMKDPTRTFGDDVSFLSRNVYTLVLSDSRGQAQIAVVPKFQGRVMTSTAEGTRGQSFGFINYEVIEAKKLRPHMNNYGGEERMWIGPEGGQFGIFFSPGSEFKYEDWQVPAALDTEPFEILEKSSERVTLRKKFSVTNYSNKTFDLSVTRTVRLMSPAAAWRELGTQGGPGAAIVGYETVNRVANNSRTAWRKEDGLLSIWIMGMYAPAGETTVVIPIREGDENQLGPEVKADCFGKVGPERLTMKPGAVLLKADGKARGKIGVSAKRTKGLIGSYDAGTQALTIVQFMPIEPNGAYVNSEWKMQKEPYAGDAVNAYNDGAGFFELENSSPALALGAWETASHTSRTYHIRGKAEALEPICRGVLGVSLGDIGAAKK